MIFIPKGLVTNGHVTKGELYFSWCDALGEYRDIRGEIHVWN